MTQKLNAFTFNYADQPDVLVPGVFTAAQLKANMDSRAEQVRVLANAIIDDSGLGNAPISVTAPPYLASGSAQSTTGSMTAGQPALTLPVALDFKNGQGISVAGAGVAGAILVTTVLTGGGTTTLTLAVNATTTVSNVVITHDDTAAIQAAINAISVTGGKLEFPPGTYSISTVTIPNGAKSIRFIGGGWAWSSATIIRGKSATSMFFFANASHGHSFEHMEIDGNNISTTGIDATNAGFLKVLHCYIHNVNGKAIYNNQGIPFFEGNYIAGCTGDAIDVLSDGFICNNEISGNGGAGIRIRAGGMRVSNNDINSNTGYGICLDGAGATGANQIAHNDISHNYIEDNGVNIYGVRTTGTKMSYLTISDNYLSVSGGGKANTSMISLDGVTDSVISNNNILGGTQSGNKGDKGISLINAERCTVSGGSIKWVVNNPIIIVDSVDIIIFGIVISDSCIVTTVDPYGVVIKNGTAVSTRIKVDNIEFVDGRGAGGYLGGVKDSASGGNNTITNCFVSVPVPLSNWFVLHASSYFNSRKNNDFHLSAPAGLIIDNGGLFIMGNAWNANLFSLGTYYLWMDASGKTRIKNGVPASDTDGNILNSNINGTTAARPTAGLSTGMTYFDTTLNKPIWRNTANTGWVDATGTAV